MINEYLIPIASAKSPCNGGKIAPPTIIIISIDDADAVWLPNPSIANVKTLPHIMELNNPIAKMHQTAIVGATIKDDIIKPKFTKANIPKLKAGLPSPR